MDSLNVGVGRTNFTNPNFVLAMSYTPASCYRVTVTDSPIFLMDAETKTIGVDRFR